MINREEEKSRFVLHLSDKDLKDKMLDEDMLQM
jgi:hypothetical protein